MSKRNRVAKVITWRVLSMTVAVFVSWLYMEEFRKSLELTVILTVLMTFMHYAFETAWEKRFQ